MVGEYGIATTVRWVVRFVISSALFSLLGGILTGLVFGILDGVDLLVLDEWQEVIVAIALIFGVLNAAAGCASTGKSEPESPL
jgi:hypothetical protein